MTRSFPCDSIVRHLGDLFSRHPRRESLKIVSRAGGLTALALLLALHLPSQQGRQILSGTLRTAVATGQAKPLGDLPAETPMHLAVELPLRNQAELSSLLQRLQDPASPDYRHFLSVEQFTAAFGPAQADYDAVAGFARANGFTVSPSPKNRLIIDIYGTVDQVNRVFHVTMRSYQHPSGNRTFFSPDREPSLDLDVPVSSVAGMDNYILPYRKLSRGKNGSTPVHATGSGPGSAFLAGDMRAAYYGSGSLDGFHQSVGLFELDGYNSSDVVSTFDNVEYSVPINNILLDGASAGSDGDDGEQVLDIVQAIGMAPGLDQVLVYIAPLNDSVGDVFILNRMATDDIAKQLSSSWGWNPDKSSDDPIFLEMAAQGQTIFDATGDSGALTGNNNNDDYLWPGDDANLIAVGATDLVTNGAGGAWVSETAWSNSNGGPSDNGILIPPWQVGVASTAADASTTLRNVPDVAAEGNYDNYLCHDGQCAGDWGGTSYAAPRWAGFMALVNQQAVSAGLTSGLGFIDLALYTIGQGPDYDSDFHDIVSGNNDCCGQSVYWNAVPGYDLVTGWGSPNGQNLIDALVPTPPSLTSPTASILAGSTTFTWNPGSGSSNFALWVGTSAGSKNLYTSGVMANSVTSRVVTIPANGATLYVTLNFEVNEHWYSRSYPFTEAQAPVLTSPTASTLAGATTFTWSAGTGASNFALWLGTTGPDTKDFYTSGVLASTVTSRTVTIPVNGYKLYVSLYFEVNGVWDYQSYTFNAAQAPNLTGPAGSTLAGATTFTWSPGTGSSNFALWIGTSPDSKNLYTSGVLPSTITSRTVTIPADGAELYVSLYYELNGVWAYQSKVFAEAQAPSLTAPTPSTPLSGSTTFTWSPGTGSSNFALWIGTTAPDTKNLYTSGVVSNAVTSRTVTIPANGAPLYVTLNYEVDGIWSAKNYTFSEAP